MLWLVPADRVHSRREFTAPRDNAAPSLLPDGIPYNALVSFCGKGTQPQRDLQLLEPMRYQGLLPDGIPYRALDSACGNGPTAIAWATSVSCRGGAYWRSLAFRDGLQRGHQHVREGHIRREPGSLSRQCHTKASCQMGLPTALWSGPAKRAHSRREP